MKKDIAFGGVTRIPGGALSSDGDLCAAVDVCNDGAGLELLEKPEPLFTLESGEELLCVHEPEGEEKHYITQWVVESTVQTNAAPLTRSGIGLMEERILNDDAYNSQDTTFDPTTYTPPTTPQETITSDYTTWVANNTTEDDGGTSYAPSAGDPDPVESGHIYLCYWCLVGTEYTRVKLIDITPYGKVTAIQPMGNTLICNHEGGAEFPKEIRYWLWKADASAYIGLGSKPPMINITFSLESTFEYYPKTESTFNNDNTDYKRYGGVQISSYPYTDTVPVWFSDYKKTAYVPPYVLYMDGSYSSGAHSINDTDIFSHWQSSYSIENVVSPDGKTDVAGMKTNWTTMALGAYNKFIAEQNKDNKFVFPFYVRYAYEMYDGSLIMHSYPVLMIPNSRGPIFALDGRKGLKADRDDKGESYEKVRIDFQGRVYGFSSKLMYDLKQLSSSDLERLQNWKDLIRGISVYVTPPIYNYKQGGHVLGWRCMDWRDPINGALDNGDTPWNKYYTIGKVNYTDETGSDPVEQTEKGIVSYHKAFVNILGAKGDTKRNKIFWPWVAANNTEYPIPDYILEIPQKDDTEVMELHENAGQFYRFASVEYEKLIDMATTAQGEIELEAGKKVLNTISNQDIMQDDNGSHDTMSADVLYGYNRRLNMANVSKIMHSPLPPSVMWAREHCQLNGDELSYPYQVTIYAKNGAEIARLKSTEDEVNCAYPQSIFYPDPNAFEVLITRDLDKFRIRLKEHKALNGAFWISDFLNTPIDINKYKLTGSATQQDLDLPEVNKIVDERNKIYTSETDNPFYVPFGNINIAGGGEVRALCSATQAMSQGQFGQHPMYCFTSEGVWAMTVGDTGGWATIQPVTRDVISEQTKPLSLDSTVVFLTERGLLQLAGSDIKVLSDVLQGADPLLLDTPNFGLHRLDDLCGENATGTGALLEVATALAEGKFPEKAWLAYDYDNARIYVTPWDDSLDYGTHGSWVYNLKSGLWTQASATIDRQVPTYPELETQSGGNVVKISVDRAIQGNLCAKGLVISRPIKLADMGLLKRWREIAVRGRFKPYSTAVQVALWGTRDWIDHALVASSTRNRLTRWSGSPYFGHSVALFLTKPNYAMQVAGMDVEVDAEHDNKLR